LGAPAAVEPTTDPSSVIPGDRRHAGSGPPRRHDLLAALEASAPP